ncbi:MAG TPA: thioredoxin family protein [Tepidisphaeraceae bacterium]|jgi:thiol:disulfide interchange protein
MKPAFKPVLVVLGMVALMAAFTLIRHATEPNDAVPWRKDLQTAKQEGAAAHKPVFAYFTAPWCGYCQDMHRQTWPDPRVADALKDFVPVKIDVDAFPDVARQFQVQGIPRMQLIQADGSAGPARVGFTTADELIRWLRGRGNE